MAGRKRKSGKREPNGRVQRVAVEDANLDPFKERMRRYNLSEQDARDQKSSTVIGRFYLHGDLTEAEYQAGAKLAADSAAYARCLHSPRGMGSAEHRSSSGDEAAYIEYVAKVRNRYEGALDSVKRLQEMDGYRGKTIYDAMRYLVEQDLDLPHMLPGLRLALGVLAVYYGTVQQRRAA